MTTLFAFPYRRLTEGVHSGLRYETHAYHNPFFPLETAV